MTHEDRKVHRILLGILIVVYILSGINPHDTRAWIGQTAPAVFYVLLLIGLYPRFRFTRFAYSMAFLHVLFLLYAAHSTYSHNPLFNYLAGVFGWQRNYLDRLGHFAQGFIPAFLFKELYFLGGYVKKGRILSLIVILSCLGLSAAYELAEFATVKLLDVPVDTIMGTQGDIFDTYWDMLWALNGAGIATLLIGPWHDKYMLRKKQEVS